MIALLLVSRCRAPRVVVRSWALALLVLARVGVVGAEPLAVPASAASVPCCGPEHAAALAAPPPPLVTPLGGAAFSPSWLGPSLAAAPCRPSGLVSWWRGEDNARDSAGSNHGRIVGPVAYAPGRVGRAFRFDGSSYVDVPNSEDLNFGSSQQLTIELWAFRTGSGSTMHFLGKRVGCGSANHYQIAFDPDGGLHLGIRGARVATRAPMPMNVWVHLAATVHGNAFRFFINGSLVATANTSMGPANASALRIGRSGDCGGNFVGLIDEVAIYNRALSADEIEASYRFGVRGLSRAVAPEILVQPADRTVPEGAVVEFQVSARSVDTLSYRWQRNGVDLPGADSSRLRLAGVRAVDAGLYTVRVSNCSGAAVSAAARLTVIVPNRPPLVGIVSPPAGETFISGGAIPLTAEASDPDGVVNLVRFYANGVPIGPGLTEEPFEFVWLDAPLGTHVLTARARDDRFAFATSEPVTIEVVALPENRPPVVSAIGPQSVLEDGTLGPVGFQVSDDRTPADELRVQAFSADPSLVGPEGLVVGGSGADRFLTVSPVPDAFGSTNISVVVEDAEGLATTIVFELVVMPVNDAPVFVGGPDVVAGSADGPVAISGWARALSAGPSNEADQRLEFDPVRTDRPELFEVAPSVSGDGTLRFVPAPGARGVATNTVVLRDDGGTEHGGVDVSAPYTWVIEVRSPDATPPTATIVRPEDRAWFLLGAPVPVRVAATGTGADVVRVVLQPVGIELVPDGEGLWAGTLHDPVVGTHRLHAVATDERGGVGVSAPVSFVVIDPSNEVALIGPDDAPGMADMVGALSGIGVGHVRVDRDLATTELLQRFLAVVWDVGELGVPSEAEIEMLFRLRESQSLAEYTGPSRLVSLYFIGPGMAGAGVVPDSDPVPSGRWLELLRLASLAGAPVTGTVMFDPLEEKRVVDGVVGLVGPIELSASTPLATAIPEATGIGVVDDAPAVVLSAAEPQRTATQLFPLLGGVTEEDDRQRRRLFQNTVWWLLRKPICPLPLVVVPERLAGAGGVVRYEVRARRTGECSLAGSTLILRTEPGVRVAAVNLNVGRWEATPDGGTVRFSSDLREATLCLALLAEAPGLYTTRFEAHVFSEDETAGGDFSIEDVASFDEALAVGLAVEWAPNGCLQFSLRGAGAGGEYRIEESDDLRVWRVIEARATADWRMEKCSFGTTAAPSRFYRINAVHACP